MRDRGDRTVADALSALLERVSKEAGLPFRGPWTVLAEAEADPGSGTLTLTARLTLQAPELVGAEDREGLLEDLGAVLTLSAPRGEVN